METSGILEHLKVWRKVLLDLVDNAEREGCKVRARELWGRIHYTEACIARVQETGGLVWEKGEDWI